MPRDPVVVDTNVPLMANGKGPLSRACRAASARALRGVMEKSTLVLDSGYRILTEYGKKLSHRGQPGPGDAFLKWVLTNRANPERCTQIPITATPNGSFEEFPDHPGLASFDEDDHKFLAVAHAHPGSPEVLQATDTKWWGFRATFAEAGIEVRFLCPEEISERYEAKFGSTT